ncbi:MAG: hypothetical protein IJW92_07200 [Clostridia bacterium]|nr:hypothetical protein [Clostridia bacterium]
MIITFCGHAQFHQTREYEQKILAFLEEKVGDQPAELYLSGYGFFDGFAYDCCKKYKATHPNVSLVLVTPYLNATSKRDPSAHLQTKYDSILYPEIENKPPKFAIVYRNKYMVEQADYVIAYVDHRWGGAYQTYRFAKRKDKKIFNLTKLEKPTDTDGGVEK